MAVTGQSENVVGFLDTSSFSTGNDIYPDLIDGADMQIALPRASNSGASTHGIHVVDQAAAQARDVSPGAVAIANLWHLGSDGQALRLAGLCVSGTGLPELMDDDDPDRLFSEEQALVDDVEQAWGPIERLTYNWYVSEAGASKNLFADRAPHFFGINPDGTPYDFETGDLEHCFVDTTGRGYGMLGQGTKIDVMYPGNFISANTHALIDPPYVNYTTDALGVGLTSRLVQNAMPAYAMRRDFIARAPIPNAGMATVSPALAVMGDYEGGVKKTGSAQVSSHPALQTKYGQITYSQDVAFGLLCSFGYARPTRLLRTEVAPDGSFADFVFGLPEGALLTTHRLFDGLTVDAPRPHQQEVMGFVIARSGDTERDERPVFRPDVTDDALYPVAYRGTVVIQDAGREGADGREGVVRVTPVTPFSNGDRVRFGTDGGYGGFILHGFPDYDAQLALDGLRAYEARLDDGSAHAYPGAPVVNQEEMTVSGIGDDVVAPPPAGARVTRLTGESAWIQGPAVEAGTTALTLLFRGKIGVQSGFGRRRLLGLNANGLLLEADTRTTQRAARLILEDGNGQVLLDVIYSSNSISPNPDDDMDLMVTATQDDGTGTARMALYRDGFLVETVRSAPAGAAPWFQSLQTFEVLKGDVALTLERVAIWDAYSEDGSLPQTTPLVDLAGNAAFWNGDGLPDGWTKQGSSLFADI